jgi:hypothetical protein
MSQYNRGGIRDFTAGVAITQYQLIFIDVNDLAQIAIAGGPSDGIAAISALAGQPVSVILHNVPRTRKVIAAAACAIGDPLYNAGAGQVSNVANGSQLFKALEAASGAGSTIEAMVGKSAVGGSLLIGSTLADSAAVSNTTAETAFSTTVTIPANTLQAGDVLEIVAKGQVTAVHSTDTLNAKLYLNGLAGALIGQSGAVNPSANDIFKLQAKLVVRVAGAGGSLVGVGESNIGTPGTATDRSMDLEATAVDTTQALTVTVSGTWSVANAGDSAKLEMLSVIRHRA